MTPLPCFSPWAYQSRVIPAGLDYIFVSRGLAALVVSGGIERCGLWGGPTNVNPPTQWEIYPQITGPEHAASDHAAIFVDLNI